ncbi:MAG: murein L,D-transpeptidase [Acidobacteria bacterium]|nr:murein L,D-transpeptidase [Acidobacteriota bacterium]
MSRWRGRFPALAAALAAVLLAIDAGRPLMAAGPPAGPAVAPAAPAGAPIPAGAGPNPPPAKTGAGAPAGARSPGAATAPLASRSRRGGHAAGPPLSPAEVKAAQRRLAELGYWAGSAAGPWDATWRHALIAFQKVQWRKPTGVLTRAELNEMASAAPPVPRETGPAHIEVDLERQVLFMVDDAGAASHVLPISTGSGRPFVAPGWRGVAETPCGQFTVFSRGSGWHKSQLGEMFNPLYLVGGIAIHGSLDVPAKPVSHGCIRIPMYAAHHLPKLVPKAMPVVVYGCKDEAPPAAVPAAANR